MTAAVWPHDWSVLALSPHTDDVELGAGGLLVQLRACGARVRVVAFARAESLGGGDPLLECKASLDVLGVGDVEFWGYEDTRLPDARRDILDRLVAERDELLPDLVLAPTTYDCHQDHNTVTQEAIRAFKRTRILGYDLPWNTVGSSHINFYVPLCDAELDKKERALLHYQSQQKRPFFGNGMVRAMARMRGEQIGTTWAEGYQAIRYMPR